MEIDARCKSYFIFPAFGVVVVLLVVSVYLAFSGGHEQLAWTGAAIASLPLLIFMGMLMLNPRPRTSENLPPLLLVAAAGVLLAVWEQFIEGSSGWSATSVTLGWGATSVALAGAGIFLIYVFWYSRFGRIASSDLSVGSKLPDFELSDSDGDTFRSSDLVGSPAVLMFYRGNWCPLCMAQIREISDRYQDLDALGVKLILVSSQSHEQTATLAATYDVPFRFLVDKDNEVARSLGISVTNGVPAGIPGGYAPDTVMPTLVVTNANGTIIFSDQTDNYRVRPEPDVYLAVLRRAGAIA